MDKTTIFVLLGGAVALYAAMNYMSDPAEFSTTDIWKTALWIGPSQDIERDESGTVLTAEDDIYLFDDDPRPWDAYSSYSDYIDHGWVPVNGQLGDGWVRFSQDHTYYDGTHYTKLNNMYFVRTGQDSTWREISKSEYDNRSARDQTLRRDAWSLEDSSADAVAVVSELNLAWLTEWKPPERNYLKGRRSSWQYIFKRNQKANLVHDIPLEPLGVDTKGRWF